MYKWSLFAWFVVASVVGLVVMGVQLADQYEKKKQEEAVAADPNVVTITASNFQFDKPEYRVRAGQAYKFRLVNAQGNHGVEVVGTDLKLGGAQTMAEFKFDSPGTYDIICNIPCGTGHVDMKAKLIVE